MKPDKFWLDGRRQFKLNPITIAIRRMRRG